MKIQFTADNQLRVLMQFWTHGTEIPNKYYRSQKNNVLSEKQTLSKHTNSSKLRYNLLLTAL